MKGRLTCFLISPQMMKDPGTDTVAKEGALVRPLGIGKTRYFQYTTGRKGYTMGRETPIDSS